MARPREFNVEDALEQAMQVFWAKGYDGTSLSDLLEAMRLSKSSFYETFGSKHELLLSALDRYCETQGGRVAAELESVGSARAGIESALARAAGLGTPTIRDRGCFLNNCAVELAAQDKQAAARVSKGFDQMEEALYRAVRRGQAAGEISTQQDARALARYLNTSLNGLVVMAKGGAAPASLEDVIRITLQALD